jgi:Zn-dependent protease
MGILLIIISLIVLIFSAILHEIAHGYVADRLGDPTARLLGRLTLNPIPHIDPIMTILLPLILIVSGSPVIFGGAKPVPVDPFNLKDGKKDLALVSLAGPLTNLLLAIIAASVVHILLAAGAITPGSFLYSILFIVAQLNVLLAIFNLLPIPPLDGSKVFAMLLPDGLARSYLSISQLGTFILFFLLFMSVGPFSLQLLIYNLQSTVMNVLGF